MVSIWFTTFVWHCIHSGIVAACATSPGVKVTLWQVLQVRLEWYADRDRLPASSGWHRAQFTLGPEINVCCPVNIENG